MIHDELLAEALRLSAEDRIRLVQEIWDSIAELPDSLELSDEHRRILIERLEAHRRDPNAARPWEEIRARLESRLRP